MLLHKLLVAVGCILHARSATAIWSCAQNEDCHIMTGSSCVNSECVCPGGQQVVSGGTACADASLYYMSECFDDYQCSRLVTNFQCTKPDDSNQAGVCTCQPNHHYAQGRCWPSRDWSEECTADVQCMGTLRDPFNMACSEGLCQCADGYYLRQRGECRKAGLQPDDGCVLSQDCQFDSGVCNTLTFTCALEEEPTKNEWDANTTQIRSGIEVSAANSLMRDHAGFCTSSADCTASFECTSLGLCACPRGYYPDSPKENCLALLGSPVSSPEQCVGLFKEVRDGICACQANFYFSADYRSCVKAAIRLTESCSNDITCHTFGAAARCGPPREFGLRSCECDPEVSVWVADSNLCRLAVDLGGECDVDSDCFPGVKCEDNGLGQGICSCPKDYEEVNGLCLKFGQGLGDVCQSTLECGTPDSTCQNGICACVSGYQQLNDFCAPELGGACTQAASCVVANTICTAGTCQCAPEYVEVDLSCWPVVPEFGFPCNVTKQCSSLGEGAACLNQECACDVTHHQKDDRCWPKRDLFQSCQSSNDCYLGDFSQRVHCRNSLCQCTFEYPYSEELKTCTSSAFRLLSSRVPVIAAILYIISFSI